MYPLKLFYPQKRKRVFNSLTEMYKKLGISRDITHSVPVVATLIDFLLLRP